MKNCVGDDDNCSSFYGRSLKPKTLSPEHLNNNHLRSGSDGSFFKVISELFFLSQSVFNYVGLYWIFIFEMNKNNPYWFRTKSEEHCIDWKFSDAINCEEEYTSEISDKDISIKSQYTVLYTGNHHNLL